MVLDTVVLTRECPEPSRAQSQWEVGRRTSSVRVSRWFSSNRTATKCLLQAQCVGIACND